MAIRKRGSKKAASAEVSTDAPNAEVESKPAKALTKNVRKKAAAKKALPAKEVVRRGPRVDYGYDPKANITISGDAAYKGKRGDIYNVLKKNDGKTVEKFFVAAGKVLGEESPRGWLRFFVTDGACELSGGEG